MLHADPVLDYAAHDAAQQTRQDARDEAHADLMQQVIDALTSDPNAAVSAPAFYGHPGQRITSVFADFMGDVEQPGNTRWLELLEVLMLAARSTDPALRLKTFAIFGECAREHADMHADEAAS